MAGSVSHVGVSNAISRMKLVFVHPGEVHVAGGEGPGRDRHIIPHDVVVMTHHHPALLLPMPTHNK